MAERYEIRRSTNAQYYWRLVAANGQVLLTSETYTTKDACKGGIQAARANSPHNERYFRGTASNGQFYFTLNAENGKKLGLSEMYTTAANRDAGIEATKRCGPTRNEEDLT